MQSIAALCAAVTLSPALSAALTASRPDVKSAADNERADKQIDGLCTPQPRRSPKPFPHLKHGISLPRS